MAGEEGRATGPGGGSRDGVDRERGRRLELGLHQHDAVAVLMLMADVRPLSGVARLRVMRDGEPSAQEEYGQEQAQESATGVRSEHRADGARRRRVRQAGRSV